MKLTPINKNKKHTKGFRSNYKVIRIKLSKYLIESKNHNNYDYESNYDQTYVKTIYNSGEYLLL